MQLLTTTKTDDFASFKTAFDTETEKRMNAGLTLMQMWRDADDAETVLCLFDVNDRGRAQDWLQTEQQTGTQVSGRFLKTA
ncbi:hypothetical protein LGQ03_13670 [Loktanella sp. TSTF-M6]|uniref:Uncharacterized protein n=1 Tax=Loktanella gaetbuli TaxID=2881335 RepID=A0ABS8BX19_9RHOB|nr:hypothetical protein [Loktanella gaetbuli]MCB5200291.1 hypothetical protein [Loktanella gaetbuli]